MHARGFSLLELMLAASLGVLIVAAVAQLFIGNGRTQAVLAGQARLQEAARLALDFIARSVRGAGYLGCGVRDLESALNADWPQLAEFNLTTPVEAYEAVAGGWRPRLDRLPIRPGGAPAFNARNRINAGRLRPNSDIVALRRLDVGRPLARLLDRVADPVVVADPEREFNVDTFVAVANCAQAALFRVTDMAAAARGTTLIRGPGTGPFENRAGASLQPANAAYGGVRAPDGAVAALVVTEIYFVARGAGENNRGRPVWSLWRKTADRPPAELVAGIEDMQLLYGVDTTPGHHRSPDRYLPGDAIGSGVVSTVHVSIAASSVDAVGAGDRPLTQTFSRTVAVRNR